MRAPEWDFVCVLRQLYALLIALIKTRQGQKPGRGSSLCVCVNGKSVICCVCVYMFRICICFMVNMCVHIHLFAAHE